MTRNRLTFEKSKQFGEALEELIPGGSHTYSKGRDQFPINSPNGIVKAKGCRVWDADGNELIDWGMGLSSVSIGHADDFVNESVIRAISNGVNTQRPMQLEMSAAEAFLKFSNTEMVKFARHGSSVTTAAVKLARAYTGRQKIAIPIEHPFFSFDDWFISTTPSNFGIPAEASVNTRRFGYNDLDSLEDLLKKEGDEVACVLMEVVKFHKPSEDYLTGVRALCDKYGVLLIFDEMITGLKFPGSGAGDYFGVKADLYTYGKGIANGFSMAALTGRRDVMELGGIRNTGSRKLFALSSTHGGESVGLAAMHATLEKFSAENLVEEYWAKGGKLLSQLNEIIAQCGLTEFLKITGYPSLLLLETYNHKKESCLDFRTLFLQEMIDFGVLFQGVFIMTESHDVAAINKTLEVFKAACITYKEAIDAGSVEGLLTGPSIKPVFRSHV